MTRGRKITKSLYDWCIENNRQDILELWDYKLNGCNQKNIGFTSHKKYWFKCPRGIHESELKKIDNITKAKNELLCNQCNSFGQWLIDTYGEDALEKYWDYRKNKVDPFKISKCGNQKIYIKCQERFYHGTYETTCNVFSKGCRCPYCSSKKIHSKDSFGQMLIDEYGEDAIEKYWSKRNTVNPFILALYSKTRIWIVCQNDKEHEDYETDCRHFTQGCRCPKCNESHGEREISKWLDDKNIKYIREKTFENLLGIGNEPLRYDFYLPDQNLLIEYQGEQHESPQDFKNKGKNQTEQQFIKQQEHDRRKREYAEQNGIRLLEIWYWDFKNIEEILNKNIK